MNRRMNRNCKFVYIYVPRLDNFILLNCLKVQLCHIGNMYIECKNCYCGVFKNYSGHRKQINAGKRKRKKGYNNQN